jgi:hypothetical protein
MQIHEVTEIYKNLELTVQNKEWIDAHSEEDVKLVTDARDVTLNLISQVGVFIDLFHQYVDLIQANAIFSQEANADSSNDGEVSPTQTSPAPANRAEKRAAVKSKSIVP